MVLRNGERGSFSDTCVTSTVDGYQVTSIEGERVYSVTEEEDQESTTIPEIKTEPTVSIVPSKDLLHVFMYCDFVLLVVHETNIFSAFSTFTSRPVSLQRTDTAYGVYGLTS
jgi:hypothetical protein